MRHAPSAARSLSRLHAAATARAATGTAWQLPVGARSDVRSGSILTGSSRSSPSMASMSRIRGARPHGARRISPKCRVGVSLLARGAPTQYLLGSRGGLSWDAESEVFDVVDGLIEEHRDVVVVERVDHAAAVSGAGDQSHCAQQA